MGNKEALLAAAKSCLLERGYFGTTARDIANRANVSLAAIGYHFRSKDALMTEAMLLAFDDWNRELRSVLVDLPPGSEPGARFEAIWDRLISTFATSAPLWRANFEIFSQLEQHPEIREVLGDAPKRIRRMLAALFLGVPTENVSDDVANSVGAFHHVVLSGMIGHWLADSKHALSAAQLTQALGRVGSSISSSSSASAAKRASSKLRRS